jgi:heat shock protein HslJ
VEPFGRPVDGGARTPACGIDAGFQRRRRKNRLTDVMPVPGCRRKNCYDFACQSTTGTTSMRTSLSAAMRLTFLSLLLNACNAMAQAHQDPPVWYWLGTLKSTSQVKAPHPVDYILTLLDDRAVVRADCNRGTGSYELKDGEISFKPFALTHKLCPQGSRGGYYATQLLSAQKLRERDGALLIDLKDKEGTMFFDQNPRARLVHFSCPGGAMWSVIVNGDQAQVWFGREYYKLDGQQTASGTSYTDDKTTFETKGALGSLRKGDHVLGRDCQQPGDE